MTLFQRDKIYIPEAWRGEEALAVHDFLEEICAAIWDVHEKAILKALNIKDPTLQLHANVNRIDDDKYPQCLDDDEEYIPF